MNSKLYKSLDLLSLQLGVRPKTKKDNKKRFPGNQKGGVVISADFELAWAFRYSKKAKDPKAKAEQARKNFPLILKLFDEYNIAITWATVGHLMLEKCKRGDHDWMHRLPYFEENHKWNYISGDWFDSDPYSNYKKNEEWYAPDLIESILNAKSKHEIGCHTFSHIDFSDKNCPAEVAEDEINACISAAASWGIELKSMVFPGGTFGNIDVLKKHGFTSYRRNFKEKLAFPYADKHKLIVTHTSQRLGISNEKWSTNYHIWRIKQIINKAINTGTIVHLWFHPSDIELMSFFETIIPHISNLRDKNLVWVGKMDDLKTLV